MEYVRWEAAQPNARGARPGVFALANGLARSGRLTGAEHAWWRTANDWFTEAYPDPGVVDPSLFDRTVHPHTSCWFSTTATHLLARVRGHLDLLDAYDVAWRECRSQDPGEVLYRDDVQVVVRPRSSWPRARAVR